MKQREAFEQVATTRERLGTINALMALSLQGNLSLEELLHAALSIIKSDPLFSDQERGAILLWDEQQKKLEVGANHGFASELLVNCTRQSVRNCIIEGIAPNKICDQEPKEIGDASCPKKEADHHNCFPIVSDKKLVGLLKIELSSHKEWRESPHNSNLLFLFNPFLFYFVSNRSSKDENTEIHQHIFSICNVLASVIKRKQAEESLRRERERLAHAQEIGNFGNWTWDGNPKSLLFLSDQMCRILSIDTTLSITGADFLAHIHPEDLDSFKKELDWAMNVARNNSLCRREGPGLFDCCLRIASPQRQIIHIRAMGEAMITPEGEMRLEGVFQDITNREKARVLDAMGPLTTEFQGHCRTPEEIKNLSLYLASILKSATQDQDIPFDSAIHEMLMNALEHGLLQLQKGEKTKLMKSSDYLKAITDLCQTPENKQKLIQVHLHRKTMKTGIKYILTVEDPGPGFDFEAKFGKTAEDALLGTAQQGFHGLGLVTILKKAFEKVFFSRPGNIITATKFIPFVECFSSQKT